MYAYLEKHHIVCFQVVGSKYIRLYSADQSDYLYPSKEIMSNTSQVSILLWVHIHCKDAGWNIENTLRRKNYIYRISSINTPGVLLFSCLKSKCFVLK